MQKVSGFCLNFRKNCKEKGKKFDANISASVTERVKSCVNRNLRLSRVFGIADHDFLIRIAQYNVKAFEARGLCTAVLDQLIVNFITLH